MKYKYFLFTGLLLVVVVGGVLAVPTSQTDEKTLKHSDALQQSVHEQDKDENDDHHESGEIHAEEGHDGGLDPHDIGHEDESHEDEVHDGHDGHGEDSNIIKITREQQEEIGLILSEARSGEVENLISLTGEVRINEDLMAHLVSRVPGIADSVFVSLGERVKEGQVLAKIDSHELGDLKADYLEKLRHLELTRRTFERKKYLKQENIASEADWLEAESAYQNAETLLLSAKRRLVVLGLGEAEIRDLPEAKDNTFGSYALKSPIAGVIITKHITRGEKISEEEVFTVADLSKVWVDFQIPTKDLVRVRKGMRVEISSAEGLNGEGELTLIGSVVDTASRTTLGRVELPNHNGQWKPGLFVNGLIQGATSSVAVVVPSDAVQNIDGVNVVFVPEEDGFKPLNVSLGKNVNGRTAILAGLREGDRYVAKGAFALKAVIVTSGAGGHAGHGH